MEKMMSDRIEPVDVHLARAKADLKRAAITIERLRAELAEKDKRIAELERESEWKAMKQPLCADCHIITTEQIDAAWETRHWGTVPNQTEEHVDDALERLGIVACEECGGSGIPTPYEIGSWESCPSCHGHGWVVK